MAKKDKKVAVVAAAPPLAPTKATKSLLAEFSQSISTSYKMYQKDLSENQKLRLIDAFLAFLVALGVLQFIFCVLVGNFPFNAFLGGFCSTVGQFVLTVSLRLQTLDVKGEIFGSITPERALGDYILASLMLHFVLFHFIN
ncbi:unnamed protein product [Kuraishia capsulata CBS 1993]|uniref:Dolichyl-diphosphooligosaccharide--protein glycosyltransferase subunit OST2 n=1 Tax=Kuraishia capsulata CBS 1993 TaxID=1382522 RepID=W6MIW7_9ASCO|nr:uncharacterized protein KUCA_T00000297001 [Kuraishia capsulata CBS 1993]CDK24337.1 unnamed protein product [Kuraishia capsulata CBS 1993]